MSLRCYSNPAASIFPWSFSIVGRTLCEVRFLKTMLEMIWICVHLEDRLFPHLTVTYVAFELLLRNSVRCVCPMKIAGVFPRFVLSCWLFFPNNLPLLKWHFICICVAAQQQSILCIFAVIQMWMSLQSVTCAEYMAVFLWLFVWAAGFSFRFVARQNSFRHRRTQCACICQSGKVF